MRGADERILRPARGELVDAHDFLLRPVQDGDDGEREGVEIRILVFFAGVRGEDQALEEAAVFVGGVQTAVGPGLDDHFEGWGELEGGDFLLEEGGFFADADEGAEFGAGMS